MSIADWHEAKQREFTYEWLAVQAADRRQRERRARRRQRIRRCARFWLSPWQIADAPRRQP